MRNLVESFRGLSGTKVDVYTDEDRTIAEYYDVDGSFLLSKAYGKEKTLSEVTSEANAWVQSRSVLNG